MEPDFLVQVVDTIDILTLRIQKIKNAFDSLESKVLTHIHIFMLTNLVY